MIAEDPILKRKLTIILEHAKHIIFLCSNLFIIQVLMTPWLSCDTPPLLYPTVVRKRRNSIMIIFFLLSNSLTVLQLEDKLDKSAVEMYVTDSLKLGRTTSVPKSALCYELDKG